MAGEDEEVLVSLSSVLAWTRTETRCAYLEILGRAGIKLALAAVTGADFIDCGKLIIIAAFDLAMQEDMAFYSTLTGQMYCALLLLKELKR